MVLKIQLDVDIKKWVQCRRKGWPLSAPAPRLAVAFKLCAFSAEGPKEILKKTSSNTAYIFDVNAKF